MTASSRLLLIGASGLATQPARTVLPSAYSLLYTAGAPRRHPGLDAPDSWQELLLSHRNHGVIGIDPEGVLADGVASAEASLLALRFDRAGRTLELSLRAGPL